MLKKILIVFVSIIVSAAFVQGQTDYSFLSPLYKNLPFKMKTIPVPGFPDRKFNITKYGAKGEGQSLNTAAIQKAIDECSNSGGGKVIIPSGIWITGPLFLKNNVNLHLEQGAHLQFSRDVSLYPIIESNWEGYDQYRCASPIMGRNLKNIAITGKGIIDGAGEVWRPVKKFKLTASQWKDLTSSGGVLDLKGETWWPSKEALEASVLVPKMKTEGRNLSKQDAERYKLFFRPVLLSLIDCEGILLDGVTFQNSPAWNLHPLRCKNIIAVDVNVRNPWYSQNGDGIDVESCANTIIYNCRFDVGDDAICIKSGRDDEGRRRGMPAEKLIISGCVVYHGHGGFTVGSEMSGGVRNIKVDNCNFIGTDVGLRFKSARGRGGIVENIWVSNIYMKDIPAEAVSFNLLYGGVAPMEDKSASDKNKELKEVKADETTPQFRNISFTNIICDGAKDAILIQGLPEMPVAGISFDKVFFKSDRGISVYNAFNISLKRMNIIAASPLLLINQTAGVAIDGIDAAEGVSKIIRIEGEKSRNISVKGKNAGLVVARVEFAPGASKDALRIMKE